MTSVILQNNPAAAQAESLELQHPEWEWAIVRACEAPEERWMAHRFISKLRDHKKRHPAFIEIRVAEIFCGEPNPKIRSYYCFQPIQHFTKQIHKNKSVFSQGVAS